MARSSRYGTSPGGVAPSRLLSATRRGRPVSSHPFINHVTPTRQYAGPTGLSRSSVSPCSIGTPARPNPSSFWSGATELVGVPPRAWQVMSLRGKPPSVRRSPMSESLCSPWIRPTSLTTTKSWSQSDGTSRRYGLGPARLHPSPRTRADVMSRPASRQVLDYATDLACHWQELGCSARSA